jgi:hypothetical protein
MRSTRSWRWRRIAARIAALMALLAGASLPLAAPTIAAAACPRCYRMQPLGNNAFVNATMSDYDRSALQKMMSRAEMPIAGFFGSVSSRRVILACGDEDCEAGLSSRLEGPGRVRAFAYDAGGYAVVRFSPRGLNTVIITHELTHVEVHRRIGFLNHMRGVFPAWFDEGLAVVLSDDRRYLKSAGSAAARCMTTPDGELPATPLAWNEMAGTAEWIYAKAACRVMTWMESHGGGDAVLAAMSDVAAGKRFVPQ